METKLIFLLMSMFSIEYIFCGTPTFDPNSETVPQSTINVKCPLCEDVYMGLVPPSEDDNCDTDGEERLFSKSITTDGDVTIGACKTSFVWKGFQNWADFRIFPEKPHF